MKRLVIFDFCDTLASFQTADQFCKYVLRKELRHTVLMLDWFLSRFYCYKLTAKLGYKGFSQKAFLLKGLQGLTRHELELYGKQFVQERIENQLNNVVKQRFSDHIAQGDVVVINSGGYEVYLLHFSNQFNVNYTFSTKFVYVNNVFTGEIDGKDCLGQEKVQRMIESKILDIDYSDICVYSDSITDMPIFNLATKKVAIVKQNALPEWCQIGFEIIRV